jgi:hypothetical protein
MLFYVRTALWRIVPSIRNCATSCRWVVNFLLVLGKLTDETIFSTHAIKMKPQLTTFNALAVKLQQAGHYTTLQTHVLMQPAIMSQRHEVKVAT